MTITMYIGTFVAILFLYAWIYKIKLLHHKNAILLFFLLFFFCSFLYKPFFDPLVWIGLSILFYVAYDDLNQKSFNVLPLILLYFYFNILNFSFTSLFLSFFVFLMWFLMSKKDLVGEGEAYLLPIFVLLLELNDLIAFIYLASVLGSLFFVIAYLCKVKEVEHPFAPTLLLAFFMVYTDFNSFFLVFWLTVIFFLIYLVYLSVQRKRNKR